MVKYKPLKEKIFREYFSYLVEPILSFSKFSESKYAHRYRTGKTSNVASYFNKFITENKTKDVFKELDFLFFSSKEDLKLQKEQGVVPKNIHPMQEQEWFIDYLKPRIDCFNAEDVWTVMLNHERREVYIKYLSKDACLSQFEIFVQNYFFAALSDARLVEIFLLAYECEPVDRTERLKRLLACLCLKQTILLIKTLEKITVNTGLWISYCNCLLEGMRNAQIKGVIFILPKDLQEEALKKLYPYEFIEVVEDAQNIHQKEHLIHKALSDGRKWWSHFPYDEVKEILSIIQSM